MNQLELLGKFEDSRKQNLEQKLVLEKEKSRLKLASERLEEEQLTLKNEKREVAELVKRLRK
jgi:hypothetical protein